MTPTETAAAQLELLENVIATAQRLVKAEKEKSKVTAAYIAEKVARAAEMFETDATSTVDQSLAVSTLIQRFSHWIGKATTLKDDAGHIHWLNASRKKDWHYWRRYRDYLEAKLSDKVVDGLDDATDNILALLEDPHRTDAWDRRGLVVGHVQSGKTSNYSGLICKAADAGYKIIIVLAGTHNNLRSQTQMRLEEGFLGYETTVNRDAGLPIGVAEFGEDLKTNSATTRADNGDFNKAIAKHFHGISPEERPWLFVVKKQKTVLTALLNWVQSRVFDATEDGRKVVTKLPLLMIDDEADNASVDTGEQLFDEEGAPDEEHQPKTINSLIRQLLHAFTRKAYVGYTATPFANIFIHHKGTTTKEGPDLFPRSFIINLGAPSNYVGPARLFGRMTKDGRKGELPLSRPISDQYDPKTGSGWMPPTHKKTHIPVYNGQEMAPPSLCEAICAFVLACAVRELRGQGAAHSSMLIHVTRLVAVQDHVRLQVEDSVRSMRQKICRGIEADGLLTQMKELWELDFAPTSAKVSELSPDEERPAALPTWDEVLAALPDVLEDIEVRSINGTAKDALDYATPGSTLKVIAIGGDKLARGLTLEGLCVSYFVRTTKMYDTLMQMGRWFGYRPGYLDLCRLYTSPDLVRWFGHIADASEELREEFDFMASANLTPEDYGLKVISHEVLTVTSPLKMRNAHTLSLSYSGTRPQTILFHRDASTQEANLSATDDLIASLGQPAVHGRRFERNGRADSWPRSRLWTDVDASKVLAFLGAYATHPNATSAKAPVLAEFIRKMNEIGQLDRWSVSLLAEGSDETNSYEFTGGVRIESFPMRTPDDHESPAQRDPASFAIGVLTDPADEGIDLDDDAWRKALEITRAAWKPDPARRPHMPSVPSGKGMRMARAELGGAVNRGLLLLYPLAPCAGKPKSQIVSGWDKPIMAFAIAFPASNSGISVEYEVNVLYWTQEYGPTE
ncbi:Z1 domain-containing protein [Nitrosospira briensis]|uniref:Z1 domain-containing protein n=1 Tax=Nitrosospira briensis TaxID=35799 RepID=UPI0008E40001|nr:Z1 domain-containing protein [Nitrosospira briensis]SFO12083.1 Z1 domain-containing protein [Nitrosospira briensis]